ncbi:MAG: FAD-binding protein [Myxococcales bacterium]|nr:FAD-binding protein [Myxococcales bacterium]
MTTPGLSPWTWTRHVPGADGYHHPSTEQELVESVRLAARRQRRLRVRGSAHSIPAAIRSYGGVDVLLDRYGRVRFDDAKMQVTVEAGCHLGLDPRDPTGMSTFDRSLVAQLDRRGWALPDLGGVSHQTVAGFLSTGSSGGTTRHPIEAALVSVRWIDGRGRVREARRGEEVFDAIGCSLGLLGVISTVTLQCIPRYELVGREDITTERGCSYDLYGDGGLDGFLRATDYARLMWWPQRGVEGVITWQARRESALREGRAKPYCVVGDVSSSPTVTRVVSLAAQLGGGLFYDAVSTATHAARSLARSVPATKRFLRGARALYERRVLAPALQGMLASAHGRPQHFWGPWHEVLPMDNQMSERALPTTFTEIFVPLDRAGEVLRCLRRHFDERGYAATGPYIFELYAAARSSLWIHPSYGRDSLRVDVFWFGRNRSDPRAFFGQFWELLKPFGYRLHWGKYLPRGGAEYLRRQLPRWDDFLALRREMDPGGVFLTPYFREALGIT